MIQRQCILPGLFNSIIKTANGKKRVRPTRELITELVDVLFRLNSRRVLKIASAREGYRDKRSAPPNFRDRRLNSLLEKRLLETPASSNNTRVYEIFQRDSDVSLTTFRAK